MTVRFVIFTDLDATLLDHQTYSFRAALPALKKAKKKGIPVVLCTSKTRAETEIIAGRLGLNHPFIVENGGAVFIPESYFPAAFFRKASLTAVKKNGYRVIQLGRPYRRLRSALRFLAKKTGLELVGFGDLTPEEIAAITGLSPREAELAARREYDEPFFLKGSPEFETVRKTKQPGRTGLTENAGDDQLQSRKRSGSVLTGLMTDDLEGELHRKLKIAARAYGLRVTRGGRFFHLTGHNDKGRAVRILTKLFRLKFGKIITAGLGDSANDWPMLRAVDLPVLVARPDGRHLEVKPGRKSLLRTASSGPAGWNEAVGFFLGLLESGLERKRDRLQIKGGNHG